MINIFIFLLSFKYHTFSLIHIHPYIHHIHHIHTHIAADWLQGPYVYALYAQYGFGKQEIAQLFVAGFGSSLLFGTFIGGIADRFGRKKNCIMYGVLYSLACLSKHSSNFHILLLGRILSGISTSLLYSAFESWMVHEHNRVNIINIVYIYQLISCFFKTKKGEGKKARKKIKLNKI